MKISRAKCQDSGARDRGSGVRRLKTRGQISEIGGKSIENYDSLFLIHAGFRRQSKIA